MTQVEEYKKNMSELFSHWKRKKSEDGSINYSEQFLLKTELSTQNNGFLKTLDLCIYLRRHMDGIKVET